MAFCAHAHAAVSQKSNKMNKFLVFIIFCFNIICDGKYIYYILYYHELMYISTLISYIIAIINTGIDSHIVHLVDIQLIVEMLFLWLFIRQK